MNASPESGATLRMLDKADKAIMKLPRVVKGAVYEFERKFRRNPHSPGLNLEQLKGGGKGGAQLYSARVTREYRALLLHAGGTEWLLLTVLHHDKVYDNLDRFAYGINSVTGGIEFVDVVAAEDSVSGQRTALPAGAAGEVGGAGSAGSDGSTGGAPESREEPLFAGFTAAQLTELGVAEPLLPVIFKLTSEEELVGLIEYAPQLTGEVLTGLYEGKSVEEVLEEVTRPVSVDTVVDPTDYHAALARPATQVTTDDKALEGALEGEFARWKVFLHPTQRKLVERDHGGPARVSGGPGTGKTIVALHRTRHLAARFHEGDDTPVLLTTFNRNLAADLRAKLLDLGGPEIARRVDVVNIDKLTRRVVNEAEPGGGARLITDAQAVEEWRDMLTELGETRWDADFLAAEWSQVILGQVVTSWTEYARARRAGRGRPLSRAERKAVWQLAERFAKRLDDRGCFTHAQVAARAARLEIERAEQAGERPDSGQAGQAGQEGPPAADPWGRRPGYRYRHVVVDEAQDLHAAHWKLLRATVAPGPNDIFCVGDTHQRIYSNVVSLASLGINIRGRSAKLSLNYRTTRQILGRALNLLTGESYDDLDGGTDNLTGYRSVLHGTLPHLKGYDTEGEELDAAVEQVRAWSAGGSSLSSIAVCVPTRHLVTQVTSRLVQAGIDAVELTAEGPKRDEGVHVGTMHRFKGLEYQRLIIVGASDGLIPRRAIEAWQDSDPVHYRRERQRDRSLLFVAATRARDDLAIFWHGTRSPFLPPDS